MPRKTYPHTGCLKMYLMHIKHRSRYTTYLTLHRNSCVNEHRLQNMCLVSVEGDAWQMWLVTHFHTCDHRGPGSGSGAA